MDIMVMETSDTAHIPRGWSGRRLQDVAQLINGRGFKPFEWNTSGLPIIRIQNLNGSDDFNYYSGRYSPKIEVDPGQLLFAWSGSRGTSFGPHIWNGPKGVLNYHTWKVRVNENEIHPNFFFHVLRHLTRIIEDQAHGASALVHVQKWEMEKFPFHCPDDPKEQEAIAEALSDADALVEGLERLIAKKRRIKQGAMQDLLTAKRRLPGFSGDWDVDCLRNLVISHNSGVYKKNDLYGRGSNIVGVSDIHSVDCIDGQLFKRVPLTKDERKKYTLSSGDLLYAESSLVKEGIARTVYVSDHGADTCFAWHTRRYSVDKNRIRPDFLCYFLQTYASRKHMIDNCIQTAITGINTISYFACPISIPSISEQTCIAEILSAMDTEIQALETRLEKARQVKEGMMQNLLTGRIRLV